MTCLNAHYVNGSWITVFSSKKWFNGSNEMHFTQLQFKHTPFDAGMSCKDGRDPGLSFIFPRQCRSDTRHVTVRKTVLVGPGCRGLIKYKQCCEWMLFLSIYIYTYTISIQGVGCLSFKADVHTCQCLQSNNYSVTQWMYVGIYVYEYRWDAVVLLFPFLLS